MRTGRAGTGGPDRLVAAARTIALYFNDLSICVSHFGQIRLSLSPLSATNFFWNSLHPLWRLGAYKKWMGATTEAIMNDNHAAGTSLESTVSSDAGARRFSAIEVLEVNAVSPHEGYAGTEMSMEELLGKVAQGDKVAFRALYDLASTRMMAIASKIVRERELAEEAVQEAFIRIWRKANHYEVARGTAITWMGVITRNAALDLVRKSLRLNNVDEVTLDDLQVDPVEPPDAQLGRCLKRLPPDQARAILTMYTYGLSHSELAEKLDVPLGTVKSWVRRGIRDLRNCMES
jgi:RNA polymerase sigma-70 factor, ECF subfamily